VPGAISKEPKLKTSQLIDILVEDMKTEGTFRHGFASALVAGIFVSGLMVVFVIGLRLHMLEVIETPRVLFKLSVTMLAAAVTCGLAYRVSLPGMPMARLCAALLVPLAMLLAAVFLEFVFTPPESWAMRAIGQYPEYCLILIPVLATAPLAALIRVMRKGAPENAGRAGALAGLSAGSIAAAIYAWHCPDDSPFFIAIWYGTAIAIVTVAGHFIGRRTLTW
jgi:hypothetical protein